MRETRDGNTAGEPAHPRAGWDEAFARMASRGDDRLLDADATTGSWDEEEWEWTDAFVMSR
jgi:antitoxin MazE